jgi:microcompartment protein CcmK/EutM
VQIARVVGTLVATRKDPKLEGLKLLLVEPVTPEGEPRGAALVAVDAVGAGEGEVVLIAQGSSARLTDASDERPVDAVIMAIVDEIEREGHSVFRK